MLLFSLALVLVVQSPLILWLATIRPYCFRNGLAYTPGATWTITMWIDWQRARELAKARGDSGMLFCCGVFFVPQFIISMIYILFMTI